MRYLAILFVLSACGMNSYHPEVLNASKKYEDDLKQCIEYSKQVRSTPNIGNSVLVGTTGLAGYVFLEANKNEDDVYFKDGYELTDDCLKKKGYTLVSH